MGTNASLRNADVIAQSLKKIRAISLFVEDLQASKSFYQDVFGVDVVFEDADSVGVKFDDVFVNLLLVSAAQELVEPGVVAPRDVGSRFQLTLFVDDVDAACRLLTDRGVEILTPPTDREWGMRTATFTDPAGHGWELAQPIPEAAAS